MTASGLQNLLKNKNVVFITVKNKDYIRVTQIERLLEQEALSYSVYTSEKSNPLTRAIDLRRRLAKIDFSKADVVILGFLPQLLWKKTLRLIRKKTVVVADFFLSMYDTVALDRKLVSSKSFAAKLLHNLDKKVLNQAQLVITDTKADADFFAGEFEIDRSKFEVLYLEADPMYSLPCMVSSDDKASGNVLYFGTGLPLQGTETVLEAFLEAAAMDEALSFTYIGGTKGISDEIIARARSCEKLELIKWLPQDELGARIKEASLCLAGHFNPDIDKADRTIPGKAYIYEALHKKMILGDTKANHELFVEDDRHFFVPRGDAMALADCILENAK